MKRACGVLLTGLALVPATLGAQSDTLRAALRDELARSMRALQLDTLPRPYFISYRVDDIRRTTVVATLGGLLQSEETRVRRLTVEVRVGNYAFDNTNFFGFPSSGMSESLFRGFAGVAELPLDDDYDAIRRQLWLATDDAYKGALEQLSGKRAALLNAASHDSLPDFSRSAVTQTADMSPASPVDRRMCEQLARDLSLTLRDFSHLQRSQVSLVADEDWTEYLNSEGTSFSRRTPWVEMEVEASTQAPDGMPLARSFAVQGSSLTSLPSHDILAGRVREFGTDLERERNATVSAVYHGPILLTGEAAAQVFERTIGSHLTASRQPVFDNPIFAQLAARRENPFLTEIGGRVLPRFLSVTDSPSLKSYAGHYVGGFRVDDDGVPTSSTVVVSHGVLKTLLSTRVPSEATQKSTGNNRGGEAVVSTLVVTADSGLSAAALKAKLMSLVTQRGGAYGVVVRGISDGSSSMADNPLAFMASMAREMSGTPTFTVSDAVRVYPDGHEEPIRGADLEDLTTAAFRDLVAASDSAAVYTAPSSTGADFPFQLPAFMEFAIGSRYQSTYVVPALLFEDLSLTPHTGETPKPPVISPPWAASQ